MLKNKLKKQSGGFTIIEVLIVLAIAGLIMLIVFLAVPALNRNARNNARTNDASRIAAAITECLANRNGVKASCDTAAELNAGTLSRLSLPTGTFSDSSSTDVADGTIDTVAVGYQRTCAADGSSDVAGGSRDFVVNYQLEPNITRCISS